MKYHYNNNFPVVFTENYAIKNKICHSAAFLFLFLMDVVASPIYTVFFLISSLFFLIMKRKSQLTWWRIVDVDKLN
jgi:hypothetical protein